MFRQKSLPLFLMLAMACLACSKSSTIPSTKGVVKWPDLKALDDLAEEAESTAEAGEIGALRVLGAKIKPAATRVASDPLPEGAASPDQVKALQEDLKALTDSLADPATLAEADLRQTLAGVHPIVEKLMESSGMPHVHEHPNDKGAGNASNK